jgi:hypothetical protein
MEPLYYYALAVSFVVIVVAAIAIRSARARVRLPSGSENYVPSYDFRTRTVSYLKRDALKPGMIQAKIHNLEGLYWVDPAQMKREKYQHPALDEPVRSALRELSGILREVHPLSLEQWEDRFRREPDPAREVETWRRIATAYAREAASPALNAIQRNDVFQVLVACANRERAHALDGVALTGLARTTAAQIVERWFATAAAEPVAVPEAGAAP